MLTEIFNLYRKYFNYKTFYDILLTRLNSYPENYIDSKQFLSGYEYTYQSKIIGDIFTAEGDIRVDLPVWFGNPNCVKRLMVFGMEPRDTYFKLNVEKVGRNVFATPFALEYKKGPYFSAFNEILYRDDVCIYFTDIVKTYEVKGNKFDSDLNARNTFATKASEQFQFLQKEISIINPQKIICLGNISYNFLNAYFIKHKLLETNINLLTKVRHPSYGGALKARNQISQILENLNSILTRHLLTPTTSNFKIQFKI